MIFRSWAAFWHMGGYAPFVWSAYGVALTVVIINVVAPWVAHRRLRKRIRDGEFSDD